MTSLHDSTALAWQSALKWAGGAWSSLSHTLSGRPLLQAVHTSVFHVPSGINGTGSCPFLAHPMDYYDPQWVWRTSLAVLDVQSWWTPVMWTYLGLIILAAFPIALSCSILVSSSRDEGKKGSQEKGATGGSVWDEKEVLDFTRAKYFPVMGSVALVSLYLIIKFAGEKVLAWLFFAYFGLISIGASYQGFVALAEWALGRSLVESFELNLSPMASSEPAATPTSDASDEKAGRTPSDRNIFSLKFGMDHVGLFSASVALYAIYAVSKHWVLSNVYAEAFCIFAISSIVLDSFATGIALLSGLFIYDIFWVFGTDVMVTVAKGFDGPIKVLFPRDILALLFSGNPFASKGIHMAMLGLGDIVLPGIFIGLCSLFDKHMGLRGVYFKSCFAAYIGGLVTTMLVMHVFKAAQPALLYLSPACIFTVLGTALLRGELKELFAFSTVDAAAEEAEDDESKKEKTKPKKGASTTKGGITKHVDSHADGVAPSPKKRRTTSASPSRNSAVKSAVKSFAFVAKEGGGGGSSSDTEGGLTSRLTRARAKKSMA